MQKRSTIRQIANEAGVSIATVSRVINQPDTVKPETRSQVQEVMDRNYFVANGSAATMNSQTSKTIGLVIPTITNSIYASSTQAIQRVAQASGYTVLVAVSEFDPTAEEQLIRRLVGRQVDGLILTGGERAPHIYALLEKNEVPYIVTWKLSDGALHPSVSFDNYRAGRLAMTHLIELGHRRIGLICGRTNLNDRARERRRAYEDALAETGVEFDSDLVFERDFEFIEGSAVMRRMLETQERPTAVFCANDIQAIGAMQECIDAGINVPKDISIIGFDDLPLARYVRPRLTTVHVPAKRMGHLAAEALFKWISNGVRPSVEELPVELVVRESTGAKL